MPQWVCLLRAVNLGARNKVAMPRLREVLGAAGCEDVRTYLQSGNLMLRSPHRDASKVAAAVRSVVEGEFGIDTPVLVRTPDQILELLAWCPFADAVAAQPTAVHAVCLDAAPEPARLAAVLAEDWSPDRLGIRDREAWIHYATTMHASRLQHATLLKRLGVSGTARNWRTIDVIARLLDD